MKYFSKNDVYKERVKSFLGIADLPPAKGYSNSSLIVDKFAIIFPCLDSISFLKKNFLFKGQDQVSSGSAKCMYPASFTSLF